MFTVISSDAFNALQLDAGVLLTTFDPVNPYIVPTDAQIIATTSGGINPTCVPTYSDFGEDVDNVPNNMMEFKHLDGWDCAIAFTSIKFNATGVKLALGAADVTTLANSVKKIAPRRNLSQSDFGDIWWVGDKADGGAAAIKLKNALSTGGFSMQTTKNGKGTISMTITGHVSINAQNDMPMEFYDIPPQSSGATVPVVQMLTGATSSFTDESVAMNSSLSVTITPASSGYVLESGDVVVTMGGVDITAMCVTISETASISIPSVTGKVVITVNSTVAPDRAPTVSDYNGTTHTVTTSLGIGSLAATSLTIVGYTSGGAIKYDGFNYDSATGVVEITNLGRPRYVFTFDDTDTTSYTLTLTDEGASGTVTKN